MGRWRGSKYMGRPVDPGIEGEGIPREEEELVVLVDESVDPRVVAYHDPQSPPSEQYRAFRTTLLASLSHGTNAHVLTITSALEQEGKSISTANLGVVLADLADTKVCLIDADLRKPSLSAIFSIPEQEGLADHLIDDAPLSRVAASVCLGTMDVIPAGNEPRRAIDLLGSDRFHDMLHELRSRYDYVLIDTPPTTLFSDSIVVGGSSDGTILVTRLRFTPRAVLQQTVAQIRQAGGKVLGAFLVGADPL